MAVTVLLSSLRSTPRCSSPPCPLLTLPRPCPAATWRAPSRSWRGDSTSPVIWSASLTEASRSVSSSLHCCWTEYCCLDAGSCLQLVCFLNRGVKSLEINQVLVQAFKFNLYIIFIINRWMWNVSSILLYVSCFLLSRRLGCQWIYPTYIDYLSKTFAFCKQKNKTLSFSLLLNMTLCRTLPMFGRRHKQGSLRVRRQQRAVVSPPFVTSQGVQRVKWSRANRRIKGYFSSLTGFCTIWDLFKNQTRRALIGSRIKKKEKKGHIKNGSFALLPV